MFGPLLDDDGGFLVNISGGFGAEDNGAGAASAGIEFQSDGDVVTTTTSAGSTDAGDWVTPKLFAPLVAFEILAHQNSGDTLDGSSNALDTWLPLSTSRTWKITQSGTGVKSAALTISIRVGGTTLSSGAVSLAATAL
jgi:hypothetical protein